MSENITNAGARNARNRSARVRAYAICFFALLILAAFCSGYFLLKDRLFPPPLSLAEGVEVSAVWRVETEGPFRIGDLIPVSLEIEAASGVELRQLPLSASGLDGLEMVKEEAPVDRARKGGWQRSTRYLLTAWRTGTYRLAPANITYYTTAGEEETVAVEPLELEVVSLLPADLTPEAAAALSLKEDKGPVGLPPNYRLLILALVAGACLVLLFFLFRRFARVRGKEGGVAPEDLPPPEPAHLIAGRRLAALRAADFLAAGRIKEYYSELSFCLREYLENRFFFPALEMTGGEILRSPVTAALAVEEQAALTEVLNISDLVKFAKHRPAEETAVAHFALVEEFVEATKEEPPPEEEQTREASETNEENSTNTSDRTNEVDETNETSGVARAHSKANVADETNEASKASGPMKANEAGKIAHARMRASKADKIREASKAGKVSEAGKVGKASEASQASSEKVARVRARRSNQR